MKKYVVYSVKDFRDYSSDLTLDRAVNELLLFEGRDYEIKPEENGAGSLFISDRGSSEFKDSGVNAANGNELRVKILDLEWYGRKACLETVFFFKLAKDALAELELVVNATLAGSDMDVPRAVAKMREATERLYDVVRNSTDA